MINNFLKIAFRNIVSHKTYAAVNVLGLTLGIAACIVIYLVVSHDMGYDNFHPGGNRIYRVMSTITESTGDKINFGRAPAVTSSAGRPVLTGVENLAAIIPYNGKVRSHDGGSPVISEPQFFDIFNYEWLAGNAASLNEPSRVVLTLKRGQQYFGQIKAEEMIGKELTYDDSIQVTVSGIVKNWEKNSDLRFSEFISLRTTSTGFDSWNSISAWVFAKLREGTDPGHVTTQMASLIQTHAPADTKLRLWLDPLSNMHFNADLVENQIRTAHKPTLYGLMGIAAFILVLAVINFINLSTAMSTIRSKEVGVRKVLGSSRQGLVLQFMSETFLLTLCSVIIAVTLVKPLLNQFSSFIPEGVRFNIFDTQTILFTVLVIVVTTLGAGFYPAIVLSSFSPIHRSVAGKNKWLVRKGLIVFQFAVSLVFIIGSIVISKQLRYTREKDLGFSASAVLTIEPPKGASAGKTEALATTFRQLPSVKMVAMQWLAPMTDNPRGMKLKYKSTDPKDFWVNQVAGDENYIELYDLKILAGRNLLKSDTVNEFIINETFSKMMGYAEPQEAIGRTLYWSDKPYPVVGVVKDFHTMSLHEPIAPLCIINRKERQFNLAVKMANREALTQMKTAWKEIFPHSPFNYKFYDETIARLYEKDHRAAMLTNTSTVITIFISCIGLFGLTLFVATRKAREISIRKVLGASVSNIAMMLSKDFLLPVILSLLIASPVAWYIMDQWLQDFSYHIDISAGMFALAGAAAILIAVLTVSLHAIRAALANPVDNLRAE